MPKGAVAREITKINKRITYSSTGPIRAVLARNISREEEIEIPAASSRSFLHCDFVTEWLNILLLLRMRRQSTCISCLSVHVHCVKKLQSKKKQKKTSVIFWSI